jgi:hypothetical protein
MISSFKHKDVPTVPKAYMYPQIRVRVRFARLGRMYRNILAKFGRLRNLLTCSRISSPCSPQPNHAARLLTPALHFIITQYLVDPIIIGYLANVADSFLRVNEAESSWIAGSTRVFLYSSALETVTKYSGHCHRSVLHLAIYSK